MNAPTFFLGVALVAGLASCGKSDPGDHGLEVRVAPLALPGIGDAGYSLVVRNGKDEIVWQQDDLLSSQYGDGQGALTYVGTCDASENPHTVELVLRALWDDDGKLLTSPDDFKNPTIDERGKVRPLVRGNIQCDPNSDTLVAFNLTLMRSAQQGFFDVGVSFADVFCSAKVDCKTDFLHGAPPDGGRGATAILTLACTSGGGAAGKATPTVLYMSQVSLECSAPATPTEVTTYYVPLGQPGSGEAVPPDSGVFATAVYVGDEELPGYDKCYLNTAVGLDVAALAGQDCDLVAHATASEGVWDPPRSPTGELWPRIDYRVRVLTAGGALCDNNGLDAAGSGVVTRYSLDAAGVIDRDDYTWRLPCGEDRPVAATYDCGSGASASALGDGGVTISINGVSSQGYDLPGGAALTGCCRGAQCGIDSPGGSGNFMGAPGGLVFVPPGATEGTAYALPAGAMLAGCCDGSCCGGGEKK